MKIVYFPGFGLNLVEYAVGPFHLKQGEENEFPHFRTFFDVFRLAPEKFPEFGDGMRRDVLAADFFPVFGYALTNQFGQKFGFVFKMSINRAFCQMNAQGNIFKSRAGKSFFVKTVQSGF